MNMMKLYNKHLFIDYKYYYRIDGAAFNTIKNLIMITSSAVILGNTNRTSEIYIH